MRILLLQSSAYIPSLGGANKANRLLVEQLAARGHECQVIGTAGGERVTPLATCLADLAAAGVGGAGLARPGVVAFRHAGVAVEAVLDGARLRPHAAERLRELAPDRVLVSSEDPAQMLLEEAVAASPHTVYLAHTTLHLPFGPDGFLKSPGRTALLRQMAGIVAVSGYVREYFRRWAGLEATLLRFPVYGAGPFPALGDFDQGFVTLVNPSAVKGISIFLELARRLPEVAFAAVPTWGTTTADLRSLAALSNIRQLPPRAAIDEIFARTRVLLVPSLWGEAFGQVAVEAMLRGIPVLASSAGGLPEAKLGVDYVLPVRPIERYEERFDERKIPVPVVPAQDVDPWEEALRRVLGERELYSRLASDSRRAALAFVSGLGIGPFEEYLEGLPARITAGARMKILLVQPLVYLFSNGGAHKANRFLIEGLAARGHVCRVVAPRAEMGGLSGEDFLARLAAERIPVRAVTEAVIAFSHQGVEVHATAGGHALCSEAVREIHELDPDWTIVSEDSSGVVLGEVLKACPTRVVYLAHSPATLPFGPASFAASEATTALLRRPAGILTVSRAMQDYIRRGSGLDAAVLYSPAYGSGPFPALGAFDRGWVTMINPSAIKGISIFAALARRLPELAFAAVPFWSTTAADRDLLSALPNLTLIPPVDDLDELFAQVRVLLVPSLWGEAFGQIVVEALLRGIPVVTSDQGGLPEAGLGVSRIVPVRPIERYEPRLDERGVQVPIVPEQDLGPWEAALSALLSDRAEYDRVSLASRRAAADFVSHLGVEPYERFLAGLSPKAPVAGAEPSPQTGVRRKLEGLSAEKLELLARRVQSRKEGTATSSPASPASPASVASPGSVLRATIPRLPRPGGGGSFPLSFTQLRMWFLHQFEPESPFYNESFGVRLRGALRPEVLAASLGEIIGRHEVLRTRFAADDGEPAQVVSPAREGDFSGLPVLDLRALPAPLRGREAERLAGAERRRPFDLTRGPLLRVALVRLAAAEHHLLITVHHITADVWAIGVMVGELSALYAAFGAGRPSPLSALPIQYADYAVWQRQWLSGERLDGLLAWWRERLAGLAPLLELPGDRPRPAVQSFRGGSLPVALSRSLADSLHALARRGEATLFMVLLAGFEAFLYRTTGEDDLAVGSPIANRGRREVEGLIGCFINTLVLRGDLAGRPTGRELLARARSVALAAYAHQDLPFERLVDHLQLERSLRHGPLFQVMLLLQNTPASGLALTGLESESLPVPEGVAKLDLVLALIEMAEGAIQGSFDYSRDLFDPPTAARFREHLVRLLAGMAADPDRRIDELPLLAAPERRQLLDWNAGVPEAVPERTLPALFEAQVARAPEAPALRLSGESWSYGDLNRRVNRLARHLRRRGVGPEVRVGVLLERSLEMVSSLLAILKAGGAYVPLDPAAPAERLAFLCRDSGIVALITAGGELPPLQGSAITTVVDLGAIEAELAGEDDGNLVPQAFPDNLCYVIYTSGSTGLPKGVLVRHGSVARLLSSTERWFGFGPRDVGTLFHSYTFDFSVWELWGALAYGGRLVVVPYWVSRSPTAFWRLLLEEGVTVLNQTPSAFRQLIQAEEEVAEEAGPAAREQPALRLVIFGGEALDPGILRPWYERHDASVPRLVNMYGITETTVHVSYRPLRPADLAASRRSPIGEALPDLALRLLGPGLKLVPLGVAGEICVGGAGLARGYLGRPELTAERFVPDPYGAPGERLYRSGDLARYRANGELDYLGRRDGQVKIRGFRIELGEIEAALAAHPEVRQAVVAARQEPGSERRLVAYVVAGVVDLDGRQLRAYLKERLPEPMVPSAFVLLPSLPLTPNGKVDRGALPAPHPGPEPAAGGTPPRTPVEEQLARIWREVLRIERVSVNDNFFDLGGDSILSIQLVARARRAGILFTPREVFEHQTIAELALVARREESDRADQGLVTGPLPLTPIQHWLLEGLLEGLLEAEPLDLHHFNQSVLLASREPLQPAALALAVDRLLAHHDALRLRLERGEAGWRQRIAGLFGPRPFLAVDLSALPPSLVAEVVERVAAATQVSFDLARGPLVRCVAFFLGDGRPGRLLLAVHHWAIDGVSWRILLEDLVTAYGQAARGEEIELPAKSASYRDWALALEAAAGTLDLSGELAHWQKMEQARGLPRLAPATPADAPDTVAGARSVTLALSPEDTEALLREVAEVYRTRIDEVLLAAFARAFAVRRGVRSLLVDVEGHGREDLGAGLDLSRTVGWFTAIYPVLLEIEDAADPVACLRAVKESLRRTPGHGIGYGLLRYLRTAAAAARVRALPRAEIVFNYLGQLDQALPEGAPFGPAREARGPEHSPRNRRPHLLEVSGSIAGGVFQTTWTYGSHRLEREEVAGLANAFLDSLRDLIRHSRSRQTLDYTPADFPEVDLTEEQLALALGEIDRE
jgi:amino acid adenylation domain-containing protein/non-ribosomal peptide synthase protein (TIGR01720 family)